MLSAPALVTVNEAVLYLPTKFSTRTLKVYVLPGTRTAGAMETVSTEPEAARAAATVVYGQVNIARQCHVMSSRCVKVEYEMSLNGSKWVLGLNGSKREFTTLRGV